MRNPSRSEITSRSEIADKADTQKKPLAITCESFRFFAFKLYLRVVLPLADKTLSGWPVNRLFSLVHTIGL